MIAVLFWLGLAALVVAPPLLALRVRLSGVAGIALAPALAAAVAFGISLATDWGHETPASGEDISHAGGLFILAFLLLLAALIGVALAGVTRLVRRR